MRKNYNWVCSAHRSRDTMYWRGGIIIHSNVEKYFTEKLGQIITIPDNAEAATWEESQYLKYMYCRIWRERNVENGTRKKKE